MRFDVSSILATYTFVDDFAFPGLQACLQDIPFKMLCLFRASPVAVKAAHWKCGPPTWASWSKISQIKQL